MTDKLKHGDYALHYIKKLNHLQRLQEVANNHGGYYPMTDEENAWVDSEAAEQGWEFKFEFSRKDMFRILRAVLDGYASDDVQTVLTEITREHMYRAYMEGMSSAIHYVFEYDRIYVRVVDHSGEPGYLDEGSICVETDDDLYEDSLKTKEGTQS